MHVLGRGGGLHYILTHVKGCSIQGIYGNEVKALENKNLGM